MAIIDIKPKDVVITASSPTPLPKTPPFDASTISRFPIPEK